MALGLQLFVRSPPQEPRSSSMTMASRLMAANHQSSRPTNSPKRSVPVVVGRVCMSDP